MAYLSVVINAKWNGTNGNKSRLVQLITGVINRRCRRCRRRRSAAEPVPLIICSIDYFDQIADGPLNQYQNKSSKKFIINKRQRRRNWFVCRNQSKVTKSRTNIMQS